MDKNLILFILIGFFSQIIGSALGMAYGVTSTSFLLGIGIPAITPAIASACSHASRLFTTAASGFSHMKFGNIEKEIVKKLVIPGIIGGILGVIFITKLPLNIIKPFVAVYLFIMGAALLINGIKKHLKEKPLSKRHLLPLGFIGGFFDAAGGGWGPIVTSTLIIRGKTPRHAVGSANTAGFFVTLSESIVFVLTIGASLAQNWQIITGLIIGGVAAAPIGAYITTKLPVKSFMTMTGLLIMFLSLRMVYLTFF